MDPSFAVMLYASSGHSYLIARGVFLDCVVILRSSAAFRRRGGRAVGGGAGAPAGAPARTTAPPLSAKAGPSFNSGWVIFYTRRLYKRIEDCYIPKRSTAKCRHHAAISTAITAAT